MAELIDRKEIFFEGKSGNINGWYFDDIEIYTIDKLNLGLMSINMPEIIGTNDNEISFTISKSSNLRIFYFIVETTFVEGYFHIFIIHCLKPIY